MIERSIVEVDAVSCRLIEASWHFAHDQVEDIDAHWQRRRVGNPHLFNGHVLMLASGAIETTTAGQTIFRGCCLQTDFKAFMAWREFGFPETGIRNIFSMAAIETSDGAFVLGEMASHTASAGQIYFPSGTPDRSDVTEDRVDIEGSAIRELREETGLGLQDVTFLPGMTLVLDPVRVCCMKRVRAGVPAAVLGERIEAWLGREAKPELTRMHMVRSPGDLRPAVPDFVQSYIRYRLAR